MAKTSIARGGDEILRPQSFYGSAPARPAALRTVDADGNSNVGVNKALSILKTPSMAGKTKKPKAKLPEKPKPASVLFAETQVDNQVLDQSASFPMLDAKQLRKETRKVVLTDSLKDWGDGNVSEAIVEEFTKRAEDDKIRYEKEVEAWNIQHPDDPLVLDSHGIAVRESKQKEAKEAEEKKKEKRLHKKAAKERKEKRSAPAKTPEMLAISKRAAARLAKKGKRASKVEYESLSEGSGVLPSGSTLSAGESDDSEPDEDASSAVLSSDDDEHDQGASQSEDEAQKENAAPRATSVGGRNKVKRQRKQSKAQKDMSDHGPNEDAETAALKKSKHSKQPPKKNIAKPSTRKQRVQKNNKPDEEDPAAEDTQLAIDAVTTSLAKAKGKASKAEERREESKKSKQKKDLKRSRQEVVNADDDQHIDPAPKTEPAPKNVPKKAKKAKQALGPVIKTVDQVSSKPDAKRKRTSKRRSQGAAVEPRQQSRRLSGGSAASQGVASIKSGAAWLLTATSHNSSCNAGEYCGEYALDV